MRDRDVEFKVNGYSVKGLPMGCGNRTTTGPASGAFDHGKRLSQTAAVIMQDIVPISTADAATRCALPYMLAKR